MEQDVLAVAWSPDGRRVVSAGFEPAVHWWDARTGERIKQQGGHGVAVHELAFSKDGKLLVSAGADATVRLWDGASGALRRTLPVGSLVYAVAVRPDGKRVASGSFDGLVRLWDPASGRHLLTLLTLPAGAKGAEWLALTPEGYAAGSPGVLAEGRWQMNGQMVAGERAWQALRQPQAVARALRGEAVGAPVFKK
jgi:WD40 repeat protein